MGSFKCGAHLISIKAKLSVPLLQLFAYTQCQLLVIIHDCFDPKSDDKWCLMGVAGPSTARDLVTAAQIFTVLARLMLLPDRLNVCQLGSPVQSLNICTSLWGNFYILNNWNQTGTEKQKKSNIFPSKVHSILWLEPNTKSANTFIERNWNQTPEHFLHQQTYCRCTETNTQENRCKITYKQVILSDTVSLLK